MITKEELLKVFPSAVIDDAETYEDFLCFYLGDTYIVLREEEEGTPVMYRASLVLLKEQDDGTADFVACCSDPFEAVREVARQAGNADEEVPRENPTT